jgi:HAD superfamily hydrolase (TIGR01450 family)
MHRNLHWRTAEGFALDTGAFVAGLEAAAGVTATVVGKPSPAMFHAALSSAGATPDTAVMVGDDLHSDVLGAQAVGVAGVLVRTGKYRAEDVERAAWAGEGRPDHVVDSIVDVPALVGLR